MTRLEIRNTLGKLVRVSVRWKNSNKRLTLSSLFMRISGVVQTEVEVEDIGGNHRGQVQLELDALCVATAKLLFVFHQQALLQIS